MPYHTVIWVWWIFDWLLLSHLKTDGQETFWCEFQLGAILRMCWWVMRTCSPLISQLWGQLSLALGYLLWLRVPGGVQHVVWTRLQSFLLLENLLYYSAKTVHFLKSSIIRHCHCSSDTLTHCNEMPASLNGQLQMQHQIMTCMILTTLLNGPGIHKRAISSECDGRNFYFLFLEKIIWFSYLKKSCFFKEKMNIFMRWCDLVVWFCDDRGSIPDPSLSFGSKLLAVYKWAMRHDGSIVL